MKTRLLQDSWRDIGRHSDRHNYWYIAFALYCVLVRTRLHFTCLLLACPSANQFWQPFVSLVVQSSWMFCWRRKLQMQATAMQIANLVILFVHSSSVTSMSCCVVQPCSRDVKLFSPCQFWFSALFVWFRWRWRHSNKSKLTFTWSVSLSDCFIVDFMVHAILHCSLVCRVLVSDYTSNNERSGKKTNSMQYHWWFLELNLMHIVVVFCSVMMVNSLEMFWECSSYSVAVSSLMRLLFCCCNGWIPVQFVSVLTPSTFAVLFCSHALRDLIRSLLFSLGCSRWWIYIWKNSNC